MKRAGTLLIAAVLLLTLCACKRETRPAVGLGTFHGEQVSVYGGDWQPIGEVVQEQAGRLVWRYQAAAPGDVLDVILLVPKSER